MPGTGTGFFFLPPPTCLPFCSCALLPLSPPFSFACTVCTACACYYPALLVPVHCACLHFPHTHPGFVTPNQFSCLPCPTPTQHATQCPSPQLCTCILVSAFSPPCCLFVCLPFALCHTLYYPLPCMPHTHRTYLFDQKSTILTRHLHFYLYLTCLTLFACILL